MNINIDDISSNDHIHKRKFSDIENNENSVDDVESQSDSPSDCDLVSRNESNDNENNWKIFNACIEGIFLIF